VTIWYYFEGKPTTRKYLEGKFGVHNIKRRIDHARDVWGKDPYVKVSWQDGVTLVNRLIC